MDPLCVLLLVLYHLQILKHSNDKTGYNTYYKTEEVDKVTLKRDRQCTIMKHCSAFA